jgi:putative lipoic acid-binding regulatory protein
MSSNSIFDSLKSKLDNEVFPSVYLFKFILPSDNAKVSQLLSLFGTENKQNIRPSKNGNYVSVSVEELMLSADAVIEKYEQANKIKGVMSL